MISSKHLVVCIAVLCLSHGVQAGQVRSCSNVNEADYSDSEAPATYGVACNDTAQWQSLGAMTKEERIAERNRKNSGSSTGTGTATGYYNSSAYTNYTEEGSQNAPDSGDDGVKWRVATGVNSKGKTTWSSWSNTGSITQGDDVQFQFSVWRSQTGTHEYDKIKSWIDWNNDGAFDNSKFAGRNLGNNVGNEVLIDKDWALNENARNKLDTSGSKYNTDLGMNNSADLFRKFTVRTTVPLDAVVGDTWLRARVVCENSLSSYAVNYNLLPDGYQHQGETEDYKLTIAKKETVTNVPEPTTLWLFASSFALLLVKRRKQ